MSREVRVCENCGTANEIDMLECKSCGYDLSFVIPTIEDETSEKQWVISSNNGTVSAPIGVEEIVGREGTILADYVNDSDYISRRHAKLTVEKGKLYVTDISTNGTTINGIRIAKNEKVPVGEKDEIAFADMAFRVSVKDAD